VGSFSSLYSNSGHYNNPMRDRYERDRYYNSFNDQIFEPVLSRQIVEQGFVPHYPGNKKLAVCISHDIDLLYVPQTAKRKLVNTARSLLKGQLGKSYASLRSLGTQTIYDPYNLENLVDINNSFDIKSSYYFLSLTEGDEDYNYEVAGIRDQLKLVSDNRCEIGLHGGHQAYNNKAKLLAEKERLEKVVGHPLPGYRNHYLRFQLPQSWRNLAEAGFSYDTTLGYADCAGFRNGMCFPFYPYDATKKEFIDIVELPLMVMDASLFYYMRLDETGSLKLCREILEKVAACGGVFTLLWHNNSMAGELGSLYKRMLDLLQEFDPWFTTSASLIDWWKKEKLLEQSHHIIQKLVNP